MRSESDLFLTENPSSVKYIVFFKFHWICFKGEFSVFSPLALLLLVFATVFTVELYAARCLGSDAPKPKSRNSNLKHESPCLGTQTLQSFPAFSFIQLTTRWSCCLKNCVALLRLYMLSLCPHPFQCSHCSWCSAVWSSAVLWQPKLHLQCLHNELHRPRCSDVKVMSLYTTKGLEIHEFVI